MSESIIQSLPEMRNRNFNDGLRARYNRGELVRLCRGAYYPTGAWMQATVWQRYRLVIEATARVYPETVFCFESAAFLWGLPLLHAPQEIAVAVAHHGNSRVSPPSRLISERARPLNIAGYPGRGFGIRRRLREVEEPVTLPNGATVTSYQQTLADCAGFLDFQSAVAILDAAGRRARAGSATRDGLLQHIARLPRASQQKRANEAWQFSDPRSESPGESLSRANMYLLRFAPPQLQVPIGDEAGTFARADYFWPEVNLVGEFDGRAKYLRAAEQQKRPIGDIVMDEKDREDRIRRTGRGVVRWDWGDAKDLRRFEAILRRAGVPQGGRTRRQ